MKVLLYISKKNYFSRIRLSHSLYFILCILEIIAKNNKENKLLEDIKDKITSEIRYYNVEIFSSMVAKLMQSSVFGYAF